MQTTRLHLILGFIIIVSISGKIQAQYALISLYHYYKFEGDADPEFDQYLVLDGELDKDDVMVQWRNPGEHPGVYWLAAHTTRGEMEVDYEYWGGSLTILGLPSIEITNAGGVTIGSLSDPAKGALLQLKQNDNIEANSTKGLMLSRIRLTVLDELSDIGVNLNKKDHVGLVVYNTNENPGLFLYKGLYVWDGNRWRKVQAF